MSSEDTNTVYPRMLKAHLKAQKGKPATVVGRLAKVLDAENVLVLQVDPESTQLCDSGKAEVKVRVKNIDMAEFNGLSYVQVYGIVTPGGDDTIEMEGYTDFRDNFGTAYG